jgi:hypothetical protein
MTVVRRLSKHSCYLLLGHIRADARLSTWAGAIAQAIAGTFALPVAWTLALSVARAVLAWAAIRADPPLLLTIGLTRRAFLLALGRAAVTLPAAFARTVLCPSRRHRAAEHQGSHC